MIKPKKTIKILSALLLLVILWAVFLLVQGLFARSISNHELYIPKNTESVLEIDGENMIRAFVQDVLLERQFDEKLDIYLKSSESSESFGIDYLSTFYVFTVEKDSKVLTGVLMNVLDDDLFVREMKLNPESGTGFAVKNGVGLILFDSGKNPMNLAKLNAYASKIVQNKSTFDLKKLPKSSETRRVNFWQKEYTLNDGARTFSDISMSLSVEGAELNMQGSANYQSSINRSYPVLEKSDLSIQTQIIPNHLSNFLSTKIQNIGFAFPKLSYFSGNYHYAEPSPIEGLIALPNFDGIYSFNENFQIQIPLIALAASGKIHSLTLDSFGVSDKTFYYQQIDPATIYLGRSKYCVETVDKNALFQVSGDLKQLLKIRNGGIMTRFLSLSKEYNAAKRFLSGIKDSDFQMVQKDAKTVNLSAHITFEDDKSALNEAIRFVLDIGLLE